MFKKQNFEHFSPIYYMNNEKYFVTLHPHHAVPAL